MIITEDSGVNHLMITSKISPTVTAAPTPKNTHLHTRVDAPTTRATTRHISHLEAFTEGEFQF